MYVPIGKGRSILSKEGRAWKDMAAAELQAQRGIGFDPAYWRADVLIPGRGARCDLTNYEKALTDALVKAGKVPDDRYLVDYRIRFHGGSSVKIAIKQEELSKWATIKKTSRSLMKKLGKSSQSTRSLL
jgi:hypothetical protein